MAAASSELPSDWHTPLELLDECIELQGLNLRWGSNAISKYAQISTSPVADLEKQGKTHLCTFLRSLQSQGPPLLHQRNFLWV